MDDRKIDYNLKLGQVEKILGEIINQLDVEPEIVAGHLISIAFHGIRFQHVPEDEHAAFNATVRNTMLRYMTPDQPQNAT